MGPGNYKVNGMKVCELDRQALARELSRRPLCLEVRPLKLSEDRREVIDVQVSLSDGAIGFCPRDWHSNQVVVGAVLPNQVAATRGVREGDVLVLIDGQPACSMTAAELATALARRPVCLRFQRKRGGDGHSEHADGGVYTDHGDPFLTFLSDTPASVRDPEAGTQKNHPQTQATPKDATSLQRGEDAVPISLEAERSESRQGAQRRPPKPRRPVKSTSRKEPELDSQPRRPPQPEKPSARPREAREGGTQTDAPALPETADKGIQPDGEDPDQQVAENALAVPKALTASEAADHGPGEDIEEAAVLQADTAELPDFSGPPALIEPRQPEMPALRVRDARSVAKPQQGNHFSSGFRYFQELPPPQAPPTLHEHCQGAQHFGAYRFEEPRLTGPASLGPASFLRELPPPSRPPLPVESARA